MLFNYGNAYSYDPSSIGNFATMSQGAGAVMSVIGTYFGAKSQQSMLRAQADIDQINAAIAEQSARTALMIGQRQEQQSMLQTGQLKGHQTASMAANGIDLGEGSAARVLTDTDVMGKIDADTIAANAVRQAWGYRTQAVSIQNEALMKRSQADAISPWMGATSSMLTSAGTVASNWYSMNKP